MECPYRSRCRRYAYSRCLIERGYTPRSTPTCFDLLCWGFAGDGIIGKGRLYAEEFPSCSDGTYHCLCPNLDGGTYDYCHEHKRESARETHAKYEAQKRSFPNGKQRAWIPKEVRHFVAKRDRYKCRYCERAHNSRTSEGKSVRGVVDHVIPLARGGSSDPANLCFACRDCNQRKGADVWSFGCMVGYYA